MPRTVGTQTLSSTFKQEDRTTCDLIAWVHWVFHCISMALSRRRIPETATNALSTL
ncbi:hypothetical protein Plhal304r1_c014g0054221 [Plasmopara halstedii]